ncbi:mitochondrial ribosomal protein L16 [Cantharellus anzutake]|uniref:mitochondrial ribosomal protein L16 n=1 Tax=Cantharellus anzutake TaxID=1750568 RepID=UPI001904EBFD|nr:mitochondrial ribosomal protein L16 [Cantharellus anzutake]KAF8317790.1 mitochondrial ribosomal protein L16 [Cantharellus anzutake]
MPVIQSFFKRVLSLPSPVLWQVRHRSELAPRKVKYRKAHKGRVILPTGGSTKGTTLQFGDYGIRIVGDEGGRITAKQLQSADNALKRKLKVVKGSNVWMRVFPDIPVCVKGNETRMGKGKGSFEYWACRHVTVPVIFEVGGGGLREEIAREALKLAAVRLPFRTEFITPASPPRLGNLLVPLPTPSTESSFSLVNVPTDNAS